jgi:hypothetical protein
MAGHTPGPWTFKAADERFRRVFDRECVFEVGWPNASIGVAVIPAHEANARLIAAAPELLAAAQVALSVLEVVMGNDVMAIRQQLRAAITKATT